MAKKLTTDEIQKAFSDNSVHGMWGQTEYYSFFDPTGATDYSTRRGTDGGRIIWVVPFERRALRLDADSGTGGGCIPIGHLRRIFFGIGAAPMVKSCDKKAGRGDRGRRYALPTDI